MRRRLPLSMGLLILVGAAIADAAPKAPREAEVLPGTASVVICHATGNGFTRNEVNISSIANKEGHGAHVNNVIPPFSYRLSPTEDVQQYPGRNWGEEGEVIWTNGCSRPQPSSGTIEVFACVDVDGATFDAKFGYNSNAGPVEIPPGPSNGFSPAPVDRGQMTRFSDGYVLDAFVVRNVVEPELTWTVRHGGRTDSAAVNRSSAPCSIPPEPPPPDPVVPIGVFVSCVANHGSTFDAVFGYDSENLGPQTIPIGSANRFSPAPGDRGQPTTFRPGRHEAAVEVTGIPNSTELKWTLALTDTRMAIATADFEHKCGEPAPSPGSFGIFATCATRHGSTYDATFGYVNENPHSVKVPIGTRNSLSPGPEDRGQPETFQPGFVGAAFAVRGVPVFRSVTWKLRFDDEVRVAIATADLPPCLTAPIGPVSGGTIRKSATPRTAVVGQRVTFAISVRSNGSAVLRPVEVEDVLRGDAIRLLSVRSTRGRCRVEFSAVADTVRCRTRALASGASLKIRIATRAIAPGTARDRAVIVGISDPTPRDDAATAAVHVIARPPPGLG